MEQSENKIHIVYFSGTGSTAYSANTLKGALEKLGCEITLSEIFRDNKINIDSNDTLVLMYPVYAGDAPNAVLKWIGGLENAENGNCYVIAVSGGGEISPNTACRIKAIKRLEKKGYNTLSEYMLCMPSNFYFGTSESQTASIFEVLPQKCELIAQEIIEKKRNHKNHLLKDKIILPFMSMEKLGARIVGRTYKADNSCTGCGICAKKCPSGNIKMKDGKPKFAFHCEFCMRCLYICPHKSLTQKGIAKIIALDEGYDIQKMIKTEAGYKTENTDSDTKLWRGVKEYVENIEKV